MKRFLLLAATTFLVLFSYLALPGAPSPAYATEAPANASLELKEGSNFVSIPKELSERSVAAIFGAELSKITLIRLYDTATGTFLTYVPGAPDFTLTEIPTGAAFEVNTSSKVTLSFVGPGFSIANGFLLGSNAFGVSAGIKVSDYAESSGGVIDLAQDAVYSVDDAGEKVLLKESDLLSPGTGYWLEKNSSVVLYATGAAPNPEHIIAETTLPTQENPPANTATTDVKVAEIQKKCGVDFLLASGDLDDLYEKCLKDQQEFPEKGDDVLLGSREKESFRITGVRYRREGGTRVAGIGILNSKGRPASFNMLVTFPDMLPVMLELDNSGKVLRAASESLGALSLGRGSDGLSFANADGTAIDDMVIDSAGEFSAWVATSLEKLPKRSYQVGWSAPPAPTDLVQRRNFVRLSLGLGEDVPVGDEMAASRVWYQDGDQAKILATNGKIWHLNLPQMANGVFEPLIGADGSEAKLKARYNPSPFAHLDGENDCWLPVAPEEETRGDHKIIVFKSEVGRLQLVGGLGLAEASIIPVASVTRLQADETGRLSAVKTDADDSVTFDYEKGALVLDYAHRVKVNFRGWRLAPQAADVIFPRVSLKWTPSLGLWLGYESEDGFVREASVSGTTEFEANVNLLKKLSLSFGALGGGTHGGEKGLATPINSSFLEAAFAAEFDIGGLGTGLTGRMNARNELFYPSDDKNENKWLRTQRKELKIPFRHEGTDAKNFAVDVTFEAKIEERYLYAMTDLASLNLLSTPKDREQYAAKVDFTGQGSLTFPEGWFLIGGNTLGARYHGMMTHLGTTAGDVVGTSTHTYKAATDVTVTLAKDSTRPWNDDGWNIALDEATVKFKERDISITAADNAFFGHPSRALAKNLAPNGYQGVQQITGAATLTPPEDFPLEGPLVGNVVWKNLTKAEDKKEASSLAVTVDLNAKVHLSGEEGKDESYLVFKQFIYSSKTKEDVTDRSYGGVAEVHLDDRVFTALVNMQRDGASWRYILLATGQNLSDVVTDADLIINVGKNKDGKYDWTAGGSGSLDAEWLAREMHQTPDPSRDDLKVSVQVGKEDILITLANFPLDWRGDLPEWLEFDKIRDIIVHKKRTGADDGWRLSFNVDLIIKTFVDEHKPRGEWPRLTVGFTYSKLEGYLVSARNIGPIDLGDDATLLFKEISGGGRPKAHWSLSTVTDLGLWTSCLTWAKGISLELPKHISIQASMEKGAFDGKMLLSNPPAVQLPGLGKVALAPKELIIHKGSPWTLGLTAGLRGVGDQEYQGTITGIGSKEAEARFVLPAETEVAFPIAGGFAARIKNLAVMLGAKPALSGDVTLTIPKGNPLHDMLGDNVAAIIVGNSKGVFFETVDTRASVGMDMGPLGRGQVTVSKLSVGVDGSVAMTGTITLAGKTTAMTYGSKDGSTFFLADFGKKGVDIKVAQIFMLRVRNAVGLESILGHQYLRIDDLGVGLGDKITGFDASTNRFLYFLPSSVPPVGFAFFDDLKGDVRIAGFAVNMNLKFPAPQQADLLNVVSAVAGAVGGQAVDADKLQALSAPSFTLKDAKIMLPKVQGYAYKDGGIKRVDNFFASVFGSSELMIVKEFQMKPKEFVDIVSADSVFDVIKVILPADTRKQRADVSFTGFKASIGYDLSEDRTTYRAVAIPKLPEVYKGIGKIRKAAEIAGPVPAEIAGSTTKSVTLPADAGGGTAKVTMTVEDIQAELQRVKNVADQLRPDAGLGMERHLENLWQKLMARGEPSYQGNVASFKYAPDMTVKVYLDEYDGELDVSEIRTLKTPDRVIRLPFGNKRRIAGSTTNQVSFGRVTLYKQKDLGGKGDTLGEGTIDSYPLNRFSSSVRVEGRGKLSISHGGRTAEPVTSTINDLSTLLTDLGCSTNFFSSCNVQLERFETLDFSQVTKWRISAQTELGSTVTFDAGGVAVQFPDGSTMLGLQPGGRLVSALGEVETVLKELKAERFYSNGPGQFLDLVWKESVIPLKASVASDEDRSKLIFTKKSGQKLSVQPIAFSSDNKAGLKVSGVKLDAALNGMLLRSGRVKLFKLKKRDPAGASLEIDEDIADLAGTDLGRDAVSSLDLIGDSGKATLYSGENFTDRQDIVSYGWTTMRAAHTGKCLDVLYFNPNNSAEIGQYDCNGQANQLFQPVRHPGSGLYSFRSKFSGKMLDVYGGWMSNGATLTQYDYHGGGNQLFRLRHKGNGNYTVQAEHSKKCVDIRGGSHDNLARAQQWECVDVPQQKFNMQLANPVSKQYGAMTVDAAKDSLGELERQVRSVRVFYPTAPASVSEFSFSHGIPSGGDVVLATGYDADGKTLRKIVSGTLWSSGNTIRVLPKDGGGFSVAPLSESGDEFPMAGWRLLTAGKQYDLSEIAEAARYVRIVTRKIELSDGTTATFTPSGAINGVVAGVQVLPSDSAFGESSFRLAAEQATYRLITAPGGGLGKAAEEGSSPTQYLALYKDAKGVPQGVNVPVMVVPGGFFVDATMEAGVSSAVKLGVTVTGAIKTDGSYYFKGNGDLVIAQFTVSKARVELSSENGLYVWGNMDLFGSGSGVDIAGYIKPNGEFSFTGKVAVLAADTGFQGVVAFNNAGAVINGALKVAGNSVYNGALAVDKGTGKVQFSNKLGSSNMGLEYSIAMLLRSPVGAAISGRAFLDVSIPVYIPAFRWKCCCWRRVCWPVSAGMKRVADLGIHVNQRIVETALKGSTLSMKLGVATMNVDFAKPKVGFSW